ncbi:MAG: recombinase family protein, partial [Pirellulales bacterium]
FQVLYFFDLSRLARELVITLPLLKELVYVLNIRVISVAEGIDSNNPGWELSAMLKAWQHEEFLKTLREHVLRGQVGALDCNYSVGDWCFGYASEPIPGSELARRGRHPRPRMRYIIDESQAKWVRRIFDWYVTERRSVNWIAAELTKQNVPKDHRSKRPGWHRASVTRILANRKYIGIWPWGEMTNIRNPLTGQITRETRSDDETKGWLRELPHLRIIDDIQFFKAESLLEEAHDRWLSHRKENGQLAGSSTTASHPRHLLQQLIYCKKCGECFQVCGKNGRYLRCNGFKKNICDCRRQLDRKAAEKILLEAIGRRISECVKWKELVLEKAIAAWHQRQSAIPGEAEGLSTERIAIERKINGLLNSIESGVADLSVHGRLRERRLELDEVVRRLAEIERSKPVLPTPPTEAWMAEKLSHLAEVLQGDAPAANLALRALVGKVFVEEVFETGKTRSLFRGRFRIAASRLLTATGSADLGETVETVDEELSVEFREPQRWEALADRVMDLVNSGARLREIAIMLKCPFSWVRKARAFWHDQRGVQLVDGRKLKERLEPSETTRQRDDLIMELFRQHVSMKNIALEAKCCSMVVTEVVQAWHQERDLPVPDGRTRRKAIRLQIHDDRKRSVDGQPANDFEGSGEIRKLAPEP